MLLEQFPIVVDVGVIITSLVGAAALLLRAAEKITGMTPSQTDDEVVGKGKKYVKKAMRGLGKVGMRPDV